MAKQTLTKTRPQTFGIGAVARLTGLTDHTIRVWERRYSAVVAGRADNGRRIYKSADVEKLKLLKLLTSHGLSIGRIAGESLDELLGRAEELRDLSLSAQPEKDVSVAVLGELLPALLSADPNQILPIRLLAVSSQEDRLIADLEQQSVDVLVVELPVISADTATHLQHLKSASGSNNLVCIYGFSRSRDAATLRSQGVTLLRAPVTMDEAVQAVIRASRAGSDGNVNKPFPEVTRGDDPLAEGEGPIEPRLFTQHQLSAFANLPGTIDCECPQHLAELVGALSAFEIYSANCASRDEKDAALHRYLHRTTAKARSLMEQALERVARDEGLL